VPTELGTVELTDALECAEPGDDPLMNPNATCLYVSIMDTFGDGWADGGSLFYWANIRDRDSNIVSVSLDCMCPMKRGCIYPSDLYVDQVYHFTVMSLDAYSNEYIPSFAWEMQWAVHIVENGIFKQKVLGGYNTSMAFLYDRQDERFDIVWAQHIQALPDSHCLGCKEAGYIKLMSCLKAIWGVSMMLLVRLCHTLMK